MAMPMLAQAGGTNSRKAISGKQKALVLLVDFWDVRFQDGHDKALYEQILNGKDFKNDKGFVGSVNDYFRAMSDGQFEFDFDIFGPIQLDNNRNYYGGTKDGVNDRRVAEMIKEACEYGKLDFPEINFADYDTDGNGEVDLVAVIYPGQGENASMESDRGDYVWPHEGKLSAITSTVKPLTIDGVKIDSYACSCELNIGKGIDGIGVLCHEFTHTLGLHDMYDTSNGGNYGMSIWSLMDMGNYLGGGFIPASYTAYERMATGWRMPTVLSKDTVVNNMKAIEDGGETFIIYNPGYQDEFFLLENRQPTGWDAGLNYGGTDYGSGLIITHVDYDKSAWDGNRINTDKKQRCTIIHADNADGKATAKDVWGDPFPYMSANGLTVLNNTFSNTSTPAAVLNNANSDGTMALNIAITNITQNADGTISFAFANKNVTGIDGITIDNNDTSAGSGKNIYSLDGRLLGTDIDALPKGIYVVGGKKIVR